ncbi:MAG: CHAT domain-containing tetratricopeptide repeat protein [Bacteroidota bacterium]
MLYDSTAACLGRSDGSSATLHIQQAHALVDVDSSRADEDYFRIVSLEMAQLFARQGVDPLIRDRVFSIGEAALHLCRAVFGDLNRSTINALSDLGNYYSLFAIHDTAESYYKLSHANALAGVMGGDSTLFDLLVFTKFMLGKTLSGRGRWAEAESLLLQSLHLAESKRVQFSSWLPEICFHIVDLYKEQADYANAEIYAKLAVNYCSEFQCLRNYWYQTYYAEVIHSLGRLEEAERVYRQALAEVEEKHGLDNVEITTTLSDLGVLLQQQGRFQEAGVHLRRALDIRVKTLKSSPEISRNMLNLGSMYLAMGRLSDAEPMLREGLRQRILFCGEEHYLVARAMGIMGRLSFVKGDDSEAERCFRKAYDITQRTLNQYHPLLGGFADNLALLLVKMGRWDEAEPLWESARDIFYLNLIANFPSLSEKEKGQYFETIRTYFERYYSWYLRRIEKKPSLAGEMYDNHTAIKSVLLRTTRAFRATLENSPDSTLQLLYIEWLRLKSEVGNEYLRSGARGQNKVAHLDSTEKKLNAIEHELAVRTNGSASNNPVSTNRWKDVQDRLESDEAAVEIMRFRHFDNRWTDTTFYAAIILKGQTRAFPEIVILGPGSELETRCFQEYQAAIHPRHTSNSGSSMKEYRAAFPSRLKLLYNRYWAPIQSHLKGIRRVFVSSDGVYHQINLNTLIAPDGKYLLEKLDVRLICNTSDMPGKATPSLLDKKRSALILARPDFDHAPGRHEHRADKPGQIPPLASSERSQGSVSWADLKYTEDEGRLIASVLKSNSWHIKLRLGIDAVESELEVHPPPDLIHIATHGFFLQDSVQVADVFSTASELMISRNPLLRSGLALAGANITLENLVAPEAEIGEAVMDDGILLAEEVSHLRLEETDLVVLSACETASGTVQVGEGVYGLQRSFLIAGAKNVMMSLWSIDDNAAFSLMKKFYNSYIMQSDAQTSLADAQRQLVRDGALPCDWGAFVILSR